MRICYLTLKHLHFRDKNEVFVNFLTKSIEVALYFSLSFWLVQS
jgi:hypothetical protein